MSTDYIQENGLLPFIILYTNQDFNVPEPSLFYADDSEHAEEQFELAEPLGNIIWITQTICAITALQDYHTNSTFEDNH
jgi:hypothetical protein